MAEIGLEKKQRLLSLDMYRGLVLALLLLDREAVRGAGDELDRRLCDGLAGRRLGE